MTDKKQPTCGECPDHRPTTEPDKGDCPDCEGSGEVVCGCFYDADGDLVLCGECNGGGYKPCPTCKGTGKDPNRDKLS